MTQSIEIQAWDSKPIKYAWPGGYPVFYLCRTGYRNDETGELEFSKYDRDEFVCCPDCLANKSNEAIAIASDVNWEDESLYCEVCSKPIGLLTEKNNPQTLETKPMKTITKLNMQDIEGTTQSVWDHLGAIKAELTNLRSVNAELLAALEAIEAILDGRQPVDVPGAVMVARSAIARAKGETNP